MSRRSLGSTTTPPPSYHSSDELRAESAHLSRPTRNRDGYVAVRPQDISAQGGIPLRDEELMVSCRRRVHRRKHRQPHQSSTSYSKPGLAKIALEILKSNLMAASKNDGNVDQYRDWPLKSWRRKLKSCSGHPETHYAVHNHWHISTPGAAVPSIKQGLRGERTRLAQSSNDYANNSFENGGHASVPARHKMAAPRLDPAPEALFDDPVPGFPRLAYDELDVCSGRDRLSGCSLHAGCGPSTQYPEWPTLSEAEFPLGDAWGTFWDTGCYRTCTNSYENDEASWNQFRLGASGWDVDPATIPQCGGANVRSADHRIFSAAVDNAEGNAIPGLNEYNQRWEYLDTVRHPYLQEVSWPPMRADVSFDHMKCDVFAFFACGCGLQPDGRKAPRLDFKLSPRSPYPSFDRSQQDYEREMLKVFKRQMQREKLHWHEDKLRAKFPQIIGRDDERRKAVWAAIAEGSAVCDKRLSRMM